MAIIATQESEPPKIITERTFLRQNGYDFDFQTSDGVSRKEEAELITVGDHQGIGVKGSYSYFSPDGQQYVVTYTADDKGFRPKVSISPAGSL
ncbi:endocuticle structural glycoprotein SgAbd-5-like [Melitaea cinxia]|uniref:endocuticle structural glycoprotein SgAbd-5-like n=1 Tax=Melitaea cinxia TaxID=113334 RepID=UPI001E26EAB4|nr:endocuticle structural glycoprotein SgAbd-5-like [Melitaea cinxia]